MSEEKIYQHTFDENGYHFKEIKSEEIIGVERLGKDGSGGICISIATETNSSKMPLSTYPGFCPYCARSNIYGDLY